LGSVGDFIFKLLCGSVTPKVLLRDIYWVSQLI